MASDVSASSVARSYSYLEWSVVVIGVIGGVSIIVTGFGYGITNTTGVGAGFFPVVAGSVILLGSVVWGLQIVAGMRLRHKVNAEIAAGHPEAAAEFDSRRVDPPTDTALGVLVVDGIDEEDDDIALPDRAGVRRVALVVLCLVMAAVVLPWIGYLLTMTIMLFAVMTLVSARKWWIALIVAVAAALASRFVFETLLGTALPHPAIDFLRTIGF